MSDCKWPEGTCACYAQEAVKPGPYLAGRYAEKEMIFAQRALGMRAL